MVFMPSCHTEVFVAEEGRDQEELGFAMAGQIPDEALIFRMIREDRSGDLAELLDCGLSPDFRFTKLLYSGWTLLGASLSSNSFKCVDCLINAGVSTKGDQTCGSKLSAAALAARENHVDLCMRFLQNDPKSWAECIDACVFNDRIPLAELLLSVENTDFRDLKDETFYALVPYPPMLDLFLKRGLNPNMYTRKGELIHVAARFGVPESVIVLVKAGANPDRKFDEKSPLEIAREAGHTTCVRVLENAWRIIMARHNVPCDS